MKDKKNGMSICQNVEHMRGKHKKHFCKKCGISECSNNLAYHFCVSKIQKVNRVK